MRSANAAADKAQLATCELHDHGPDFLAASLTPCTTFNFLHCEARVQCAGCLQTRSLRWADLARTRISHDPWHVIFRSSLTCSTCGHGPMELSFSRVPAGGGAQKIGRISRRPPTPRPF